jgi:hypothetical protein
MPSWFETPVTPHCPCEHVVVCGILLCLCRAVSDDAKLHVDSVYHGVTGPTRAEVCHPMCCWHGGSLASLATIAVSMTCERLPPCAVTWRQRSRSVNLQFAVHITVYALFAVATMVMYALLTAPATPPPTGFPLDRAFALQLNSVFSHQSMSLCCPLPVHTQRVFGGRRADSVLWG